MILSLYKKNNTILTENVGHEQINCTTYFYGQYMNLLPSYAIEAFFLSIVTKFKLFYLQV